MKLKALVTVLGLIAACATAPDPAPYTVQHHMQFKVVADGSTFMHQMLEHVALDREKPDGLAAETERWRTRDGAEVTDFFLTARSPEVIQSYVAAAAAQDPKLTLPLDHELGFGKLDDGRWRSYLLDSKVELDAAAIASAQVHGSKVEIEFTPAAAKRFGELTTRIAGHKLAVLADGSVAQAPVVMEPINGGRAEVSLRE